VARKRSIYTQDQSAMCGVTRASVREASSGKSKKVLRPLAGAAVGNPRSGLPHSAFGELSIFRRW
jgi:hypothetical protein